MRSTPRTKKAKEDGTPAEKSGKKLVQARLPFKTMTPVGASSSRVSTTKADIDIKTPVSQEKRKRRLSFEQSAESEVDTVNSSKTNSGSKENIKAVVTKKKKTTDCKDNDVVLIDDDDIDCDQDDSITASPQTPKPMSETRSGAGTQRSAGRSTEKASVSSDKIKVQIKLPISNNRRSKRKKKSLNSQSEKIVDSPTTVDTCAESSDEPELGAKKLNPQKRQKVEDKGDSPKVDENIEAIRLDSDNRSTHSPEPRKSEEDNKLKSKLIDKSSDLNGSKVKINSSDTKKIADPQSKKTSNQNEGSSIVNENSVSSIENEENIVEDTKTLEDTKRKISGLLNSSEIENKQQKILTPKQLKLQESRRQAREQKEQKLQEEKQQKQREKELKEVERKREREEKEEQRRKERDEKDEQRRLEREEKERKRLAEIETKNEEKRKRNEVKEEEVRKREEERKRKDQEKEEAEIKKKKAAEAFTKFFVPKRAHQLSHNKPDNISKEETNVSIKNTLAFRPFQIRGDMKLAPIKRKVFSDDARKQLDLLVDGEKEELSKPKLYLCELNCGKINPAKWRKLSTDTREEEDVIIIEDALERATQAIVEESHVPIEHFRSKYYKFHENRRPPYYGTWRKKTTVITPRRPFARDKKYFDYEIDSDDEWEEEEPGESLDGSDDDKEKESEDDDYEVDNEWFVPHGHLSDEELQNEDEFGVGDDNTREAQKAKLKILQQEFAQEMKKKTEKIKPRLVGCIWVDENGNQPELLPKIIWDTLNLCAMLCTEPPLVEEPEVLEKPESNSPSANGGEKIPEKLKPIVLSEKMLKDLIRLIHGNGNSKVFLIKEFIAHIESTEDSIKNGDVRGPLKSAVRDKIDEFAEWQVTEVSHKKSKRKKNKKRLCWIVSDIILKKMDLEHLTLQNTWQYTLQPKLIQTQKDTEPVTDADNVETNKKEANDLPATEIKEVISTETGGKVKRNLEITKFAKVLTAEEKVLQLHKSATKDVRSTAKHTNTSSKRPQKVPEATIVKKRVPLLMSVARGQQISMPAKNELISKFLKTADDDRKAKKSAETTQPQGEDVILLD